MDFSSFYSKRFQRVYIEEGVEDRKLIDRITLKLPDAEYYQVQGKDNIPEPHRNAATLFLTQGTGQMMVDRCPGTTGHLCCNYLTVNLYMGCTIGCTYCIMQWYLNFEPITVFTDSKRGIGRLKQIAENNPDVLIRAGTGEVGDSLLYDPLCDLSRSYIEAFAGLNNMFFELKTKTDFVDHLLEIPVKGNAVIAFSLNPEELVEKEEPEAVSVRRRLAAAKRAVDAGYNLAFHFDPIIYSPDWEKAYADVAEQLGDFPAEKIVWISLGTVRYPVELKEKMGDRPYLYDEFVRGRDGKFRYLQVKRIGMYRMMVDALRNAGVEAPLYFCMESSTVWRAVFGGLPGELPELKTVFTPCLIPE